MSQPGCHRVSTTRGQRDQGPGEQFTQAQRSLQEGSPTCSTSCATRAQDEKGFTLIELLVVILIIGILAAIALPAFLNQRAQGAGHRGQVGRPSRLQTAMETYYTDNQTYVGADKAALQDIEAVAEVRRRRQRSSRGRHRRHRDRLHARSTSKTGNTFTIVKATDRHGRPALHRTNTKGGCPSSLALVVSSQVATLHVEAGLRARLAAFKRPRLGRASSHPQAPGRHAPTSDLS